MVALRVCLVSVALPLLVAARALTQTSLTTTGDVGVGISSPSARLHVAGVESDGSVAAMKISSGSGITLQTLLLDGNEIDSVTFLGAGTIALNSNTNGDVTLATGGGKVGVGGTCSNGRLYARSSDAASLDCTISNVAIYGESNNVGMVALGGSAALYATSSNGTAVTAQSIGGEFLIRGEDIEDGADLRFAVKRDGSVLADGSYSGPADFAELMESAGERDEYETGDVLSLDRNGRLDRSGIPNDPALVGVYSGRPGFLGDTRISEHGLDSDRLEATDHRVAVALVGIVPVKVTDESGPIRPGDLLTSSSTPGYAMRAVPRLVEGLELHAPGTILGKALRSFEHGEGLIPMLVMPR